MYGLAEAFVVPSNQVELAWTQLVPIVSRVTDLPYSLDDVRRELADARAQCFGLRMGAEVVALIVTRIETTPSHRFGVVWIAAGTALDQGMEFYRAEIEPWLFNEQHCEWIELQGRKGWRKLLPDYEEPAVVLRKFRHGRTH